ncbi:MAG: hypothetical protein C0467_30585 [Planctomycetaceae bacterium]|nr:hypothetical protein [Planctomycetaceae bacterium]
MEPVLIAAYQQMLNAHARCSVDRILEEPQLRSEFLAQVRTSVPNGQEADILHGLNNLRKKSKLPRRDEATPASI